MPRPPTRTDSRTARVEARKSNIENRETAAEAGKYASVALERDEWDNPVMRKLTAGFAFLLVLAIFIYVPALAAQNTAGGKPALPDAPKPQVPGAAPSPAPSQAAPESLGPFKSLEEKHSYALGLNLGLGLRQQSVDVDLAQFNQGLKDGLAGGKTLLTEDELRATLAQFQKDLRAKQAERARLEASKNKEEGDAFLEANKTKPGVVVLPSGLQYKILSEGTGPKPVATDTVECNYRGTLIDGTEFDSSAKHGGPATFGVSHVIKGWTEALQLMPVGSKWQLFIPSSLAYGERGAGGEIGPNATLVFEVELLSIKPKPEPAPAKPAPAPAPTKP